MLNIQMLFLCELVCSSNYAETDKTALLLTLEFTFKNNKRSTWYGNTEELSYDEL